MNLKYIYFNYMLQSLCRNTKFPSKLQTGLVIHLQTGLQARRLVCKINSRVKNTFNLHTDLEAYRPV